MYLSFRRIKITYFGCCHISPDKGNGRRTDTKMQKLLIRCSPGGENRLGGDEGLRGTCKERIKRMRNAYVTDKERSTNGLCRMSNGCITDKTHMYRIRNGQNVR